MHKLTKNNQTITEIETIYMVTVQEACNENHLL